MSTTNLMNAAKEAAPSVTQDDGAKFGNTATLIHCKTSLPSGFRGRVVQGGPGDHTRNESSKSNNLVLILDSWAGADKLGHTANLRGPSSGAGGQVIAW